MAAVAEPLLKHDARFSRRWQDTRRHQLLREDVRDLTRVQELGQLEMLALLLAERSGGQLIYSHLANEVRALWTRSGAGWTHWLRCTTDSCAAVVSECRQVTPHGTQRDKQQRQVDFVVIRDRKPWFLVEVKNAETSLSPALRYYQTQLKAPHAFQVVMELPFEDADCFREQ